MTLDEALADAIEKHSIPDNVVVEGEEEPGDKKPEEKKPVEKKPDEVKSEEKKEEVKEIELDASEEEIQNGLVLLRAMSDPAQRQALLENLGKAAGYDVTKKSGQEAIIRDAKVILKEKLGDAYDVLGGDGLAAALEELTDSKVAKLTKPLQDKFSETEARANEQKANTALESFYVRNAITDTKVREEVAEAMNKKMVVMPATANTNIDTYLDEIYFLTQRGKSEARTVAKTVKKISDNIKERQSSGEGTGNEERIKSGSHKPSLDEAVKAAMRGQRLE